MFYNLHRAYACSRKYIQKMCNIFQIAENEMLWVGNILAEYMNIESAASTHIQCNIYIYIAKISAAPPAIASNSQDAIIQVDAKFSSV